MTSKYNCGGSENTNTFAYDGLGNLMKKSNPLIGDTIFVYDVFRNMAAEYGAGAMEACSPCYLFQDPVWTVRLTVDQTQPVVKRFDVMPFGEQISGGVGGRMGGAGMCIRRFRQRGFCTRAIHCARRRFIIRDQTCCTV